jgi:predicted GTPase
MSRWRIAVLLFLLLAPIVFLAVMGSYYVWTRWGPIYWWPMTACFALAYLLGWHWQRQRSLLRPVEFPEPLHWTDRDRQAWKLVETRAQAAGKIDPDKLVELQFYVSTTQEMALELARTYSPGVGDPVSQLTIPEILSVIELASHDMSELVDKYLPGGHLLTVNNWRQARLATDWYQTASNVYWMISALFNPLETGMRYAASQIGVSKPWQLLQQNLLVWFYTAYVHQVGTYLIDLNSGRLRVGVRRYRELVLKQQVDGSPAAPMPSDKEAPRVTVTVLGQVKAGKSSLINALLGKHLAKTDVLPATEDITPYELQPEGIPNRFVLQDTVGYGHAGPREDQLKTTQKAAQQSDLLLLVMQARNPARQADLALLQALRTWFAGRPDLKLPPILGVMTHIDLLSPAMEWAPPYDWQRPSRVKEQQIQEALATVKEQFGSFLEGCVPVCIAPGKTYGIEEWFLPTIVELLDEAHAVALLRCLRGEIDAGKIQKVFQQALAAGKQVVQALWHGSPQTESPGKSAAR